MIRYQLRCCSDHEFEGWFRDSTAYEQQLSAGFLTCPYCGTSQVDRALMAPAVHTVRHDRKKQAEDKVKPPGETPQPSPEALPPVPDVALALLQRLRREVEANCENMKDRFADEALRIHRGEVQERGIYGTVTEEDREMLEEEGVETMVLPWTPLADS